MTSTQNRTPFPSPPSRPAAGRPSPDRRSNPGGGLWGGYAIGLCVRVLEAEPEAVGEALSLTLTYAAGLPAGELDIRTRRLRQGGSIGVWEVEMLAGRVGPGGGARDRHHGAAAGHPGFRLRQDARGPDPESLPSPEMPGARAALRRLGLRAAHPGGVSAAPGGDSRSLAWVRSRRGPLDKALLGMITDNSRAAGHVRPGPDGDDHHPVADRLSARHRRGARRGGRRLHPGGVRGPGRRRRRLGRALQLLAAGRQAAGHQRAAGLVPPAPSTRTCLQRSAWLLPGAAPIGTRTGCY